MGKERFSSLAKDIDKFLFHEHFVDGHYRLCILLNFYPSPNFVGERDIAFGLSVRLSVRLSVTP